MSMKGKRSNITSLKRKMLNYYFSSYILGFVPFCPYTLEFVLFRLIILSLM